MERSYDAGKYMQALHRIFRIGSLKSRPVNYYIFKSTYSDGTATIDSTIDNVLETRVKRLEKLLEDESKLDIISLDTESIGGEEQFYRQGDNEDEILKKIQFDRGNREKYPNYRGRDDIFFNE